MRISFLRTIEVTLARLFSLQNIIFEIAYLNELMRTRHVGRFE